jgi:hypothetical protein
MKVYTKWVVIMEFRSVHFATSKNLIAKSTLFLHHNIHKYIWIYPDEKPHSQIDQILIDNSAIGVRSFRAADCDTDHYLVMAQIRNKLAVNTRITHISYGQAQSQEINKGKG